MPLLAFTLISIAVNSQNPDEFRHNGTINPEKNIISNSFQFNGYTNYWHDTRNNWIRYGNLFKIAVPDVDYTIAQSKVDIADDINIPGLWLQEGFIHHLFKTRYNVLEQPSLQTLADAASSSVVLALVDPESEAGKVLTGKLPKADKLKESLKSHQFNAIDFAEVNAFYLENGKNKIFVISSTNSEVRNILADLISKTRTILEKYDMHRGWFGTETLLKSVTCMAGHPLEVIGRGMNEGNTWFTFSGYMDFLAQQEITDWLAKVNLPVVADVGTNINFIPTPYNQAIYGCRDYSGILLQEMLTFEGLLRYAHDRNGYAFRSVYDPAADMYHYDGYMADEGNKEQIDNENKPFVTNTGPLDSDAVPSMVLFLRKGEQMTKERMWESIMDRREVAVLDRGKMMGPALYRNALELLLLDRVFLEEYFGSRIILEAVTNNYQLNVNISNTSSGPVSGTLEIVLPPELKIAGSLTTEVKLPAEGSKTLHFDLQPSASAMSAANPIAVHYKWDTGKKSTLTMIDLPPAISAHQLLFAHAPAFTYPVTIHNFTDQTTFPVKVEVLDKNNPSSHHLYYHSDMQR